MTQNCPICNTSGTSTHPTHSDSSSFSCPTCGDFNLSGTLEALLKANPEYQTPISRLKLSHAIRSSQELNKQTELTSRTAEQIFSKDLPTPDQQVGILIRWLALETMYIGEIKYYEFSEIKALLGIMNDDGLGLITNELEEQQLIQNNSSLIGLALSLTFKGWQYANKLKQGHKSYRKAFMAMKFGVDDLDKIYEETFKPAVTQTGFTLSKVDENPQAGSINNRMLVEIQSSDFVIADLTHDNLGAYWEAGYAEGLGKPVIYICQKEKFNGGQGTHFDIRHHQTVIWDAVNPQQAAEDLKATIRATLPLIAKMQD